MDYSAYQAQQSKLEKRRALAQALQEQGLAGPQGAGMVSGRYVRSGLAATLAPLLQAGIGSYVGSKADKETEALNTQQRGDVDAAFNAYRGAPTEQKQASLDALTSQVASPQERSKMLIAQAMTPAPQEKIVAVTGPDGKPIYVKQSEALGMAPASNKPTEGEPSNIREWKAYNEMSPDDKKAYIEMKRSLGSNFTVTDVAGVKTLINKPQGTTQALSTLPQEITAASSKAGAVEGAKTTSEAAAKAAFDYPRVNQTVTQALGDIEALKNDPGLGYITGGFSYAPILPGTKQASADARAKQVEGQTFLNAFNQLRGGGAITETEGAKATSSLARLQRSQSKEDYQQALGDLQSILKVGLDRAKAQSAIGAPSAPAMASPSATAKPLTATGPNGQKLILQNGQWTPAGG